jgi:hypothetical protein
VLSGDPPIKKASAFNPRKHRVGQHATWRLCVALKNKIKIKINVKTSRAATCQSKKKTLLLSSLLNP